MRQLAVHDLGSIHYTAALAEQHRRHAEVLSARENGTPEIGHVLLLEHVPPVITVSRRPEARLHLTAPAGVLEREGIEVEETDRGGDITYHGPGQLVVYPIVDLNHAGLNLHAYIRLLEQVAIDVCGTLGLEAVREPGATGVWVRGAKIGAIGVRIRRWISMHGLALNVSTNLAHFDLIVPCGLAGRRVTSLERELGSRCPTMNRVKEMITDALAARLGAAIRGSASDSVGPG